MVFTDGSVLQVKWSSARTSSRPEGHKGTADLLQGILLVGLRKLRTAVGACAFRAVRYIDIRTVKLDFINHWLPLSVSVGRGPFLGGNAEVEVLFDPSLTLSPW